MRKDAAVKSERGVLSNEALTDGCCRNVPLAWLAEIVNPFEVVLAVDPMKFSPLTPGQGSEDGMVEHSGAVAKASFALRNLIVHGGDPRPNVAYDFFNRHPAR